MSVLRMCVRNAGRARRLPSLSARQAFMSTAATQSPKTAVVMLNMGGPATIPEVGPFLTRLFSDGDIINLGKFQALGKLIASRRTPKIEKQYEQIGGSPIRRWTETQGKAMVERLDKLSPETAPHKFYIAFRYADPLSEESLAQMKEDGVERAVAFSQYPQFSCTTTGSSLNRLWKAEEELGLQGKFKWSVLDRWSVYPTFIKAVANRVKQGLAAVPEELRKSTVLLFSAHSLPMKVVCKGDQYVQEVGATVTRVMEELYAEGITNSYSLCWQSKVGYLPWMGPSTSDSLAGLGKQGHKSVMAIPIAFTTDHVETLFEIDIEYAEEAEEAGIPHFSRCPSLNDEPLLIEAQAELVADHLKAGVACSPQYRLNCAGCVNPACRSISNPIVPYANLRTEHAIAKAAEATTN